MAILISKESTEFYTHNNIFKLTTVLRMITLQDSDQSNWETSQERRQPLTEQTVCLLLLYQLSLFTNNFSCKEP